MNNAPISSKHQHPPPPPQPGQCLNNVFVGEVVVHFTCFYFQSTAIQALQLFNRLAIQSPTLTSHLVRVERQLKLYFN